MFIFGEIASKINTRLIQDIFFEIFSNKRIQYEIIDTIQIRIEQKGILGDNEKIKTDFAKFGHYYSTFTENIKGITDHVNLKDTGEFYNSFKITANKTFYEISAQFNKENGHIGDNFLATYRTTKDFEKAVLSMTNEENQILIQDFILPMFIEKFKQNVQKA